MGFELVNDKRTVMMNGIAWCRLLEIAAGNGWEMLGTRPPGGRDGPWSGTYTTNDGQRMTAQDAAAFARALRVGLARGARLGEADIIGPMSVDGDEPAKMSEEAKQAMIGQIELLERQLRELFDRNPTRFGSFVDGIEDVANFAEEGEFEIW